SPFNFPTTTVFEYPSGTWSLAGGGVVAAIASGCGLKALRVHIARAKAAAMATTMRQASFFPVISEHGLGATGRAVARRRLDARKGRVGKKGSVKVQSKGLPPA